MPGPQAAGNRAEAHRKIRSLAGAYGEALLVERLADGAHLVIKEVRSGHMTEDELAKAQQEAAVLGRLRHGNIIACVESFVDPSLATFNIVTKFVDRGDLSELVKGRAARGGGGGGGPRGGLFSEGEVLSLFVQLCRAIRHVHGLNIMHRDLKSQNVFLASGPRGDVVKLGDFGIAKVMNSTKSLAETQIGTPYYLSPEVHRRPTAGRHSGGRRP